MMLYARCQPPNICSSDSSNSTHPKKYFSRVFPNSNLDRSAATIYFFRHTPDIPSFISPDIPPDIQSFAPLSCIGGIATPDLRSKTAAVNPNLFNGHRPETKPNCERIQSKKNNNNSTTRNEYGTNRIETYVSFTQSRLNVCGNR